MTPESELARRQASEDLVDIAALRQSTTFNRYWIRQMRARREKLLHSLLNDPPSKVDSLEREVIRRLINQLDDLEKMPAQHAASAETLLRA